MSELTGKGNLGAVKLAYLKTLRYLCLMLVPAAAGITLFTGDLVSFWLGEHQYAGPIMAIGLAVYVLIQVLSHLHGLTSLAIGRIENWSYLSIACGILGVMLGFFAGHKFGLQWILPAITLMMAPLLAFLVYRVWTSLSISPTDVWSAILPVLKASIVLIPFSYWGIKAAKSSDLSVFIIVLCFYSLSVAAATWIVGINTEERSAIKKALDRYFRPAETTGSGG